MTTDGFATQLSLGVEPGHNNRNLFSDHYLNVLLQSDPRWQAAAAEAEAFLDWLGDLHAAEGDHLAGYNEHQLETHWFRPIFERLGHVYEGQASVPGLGAGVRQPDYVFFTDDAARQGAAGAQGTAAYADDALAVGEVKRWGVALGKKVKGGGPSFDDQNPSYQIDYYLKATGVDWGILSNGRQWRLVHRESSQRLTVYYEVDVIDLLERDDAGAMRFFTLFFRQAAFRPDANGRVFLDDALRASSEYALALEEDLQENVYRALEQLMQGFLDLPRNDLGAADLPAVYDNCLILLYRLLFIFYAESRELLPVRNHRYREHYSLGDLAREIADDNVPTAPTSTVNWANLQNLFHIVNGDDEALNRDLGVPRYNGGLFSRDLHPFLETKAVGDRALVRAVDLLARRETGDGGKRETVDYRTLGVRQLGSVYEGLLEYRPQLAEEDVVAVREGGREEVWLPAAEAAEGASVIERRRAGEVYLATDRGERKATGSYYTPQYIVAYIVENVLGPLVEEIATRAREEHEAAGTQAERDAAAQALVDDVLDLTVLDPAMGSGHFLVEATDFLARELATDPIVQRPADGAAQGETTLNDDVVYWRRRVVERCIYGVDKNPLAVELAKLSLWLNTVAADQPLSFLDHHLQCGDSLVGADVADLGWAPPIVLDKKAQKKMEQQKAGQMNLFEYRLSQQLPAVLGKVLEITGRESDSYETVQAKEAADEAVRQLKAPFEAVADLWTSAYFGNEMTSGAYGEALDAIGKERLWEMPAVERARAMAEERRFFHWHLAFPEVFYDGNGQWLREAAGFDAVVGNPPYVRIQELVASDTGLVDFLNQFFESTTGSYDLYIPFVEQGFALLANGGFFAFILPNKFAKLSFASRLRQMLIEKQAIHQITDFGDNQIFPGLTTYTAILTLAKRPQSEFVFLPIPTASAPSEIYDRLMNPPTSLLSTFSFSELNGEAWSLVSGQDKKLATKLEAQSSPLIEVVENIIVGLQTSADRIYIVEKRGVIANRYRVYSRSLETEIELEAELLKPLISGSDVSRYAYPDTEELLIFPYALMTNGAELISEDNFKKNYPRTWSYLKSHESELRKRESGKMDHDGWYAFGRTQNLDKHEQPKLGVARLAERLRFVGDFEGRVYLDNVDVNGVLFLDDESLSGPYLLALANSRLLDWYFKQGSVPFRGNYYSANKQFISGLPMRNIDFTTPSDERQRLLEKGKTLYERALEKGAAASVDNSVTGFVDRELEEGRSDVVHDLLAFLAERMIAMNEEKQQVVADFWLDLEGVADPETFDTLRNRGKWEASLWKDEACRPFVDEESRSTRHLDESLGWNEDAFKAFVKMLAGSVDNLSGLVRVYGRYHARYRALSGRLAATDGLIDRVVYRLYGLTEEEIAIVEGG